VTKFCVIPELFVMPTPLMVSVNEGLAVMVKALAPELNAMPLTSVSAEMETPLVLEDANVAVSNGPLGMVGGVQLVAWFQYPVAGLVFQVALSAKVLLAVESISSTNAARNSGVAFLSWINGFIGNISFPYPRSVDSAIAGLEEAKNPSGESSPPDSRSA
jgi:hypothetical protein